MADEVETKVRFVWFCTNVCCFKTITGFVLRVFGAALQSEEKADSAESTFVYFPTSELIDMYAEWTLNTVQ